MKPTLIIILERARAIFKTALNHVIAETELPAYLIEGVLLDLLAEVRVQKAAELAAVHEETLKQIQLLSPTLSDKTDNESEEKEAKTND